MIEKKTYLKIGSFSIKVYDVVDFYVEYDQKQNPYDFFLPKHYFFNEYNIFSFLNEAFSPKESSSYFSNIFKGVENSIVQNEEFCELITLTMFKYQKYKANEHNIDNLESDWLAFKNEEHCCFNKSLPVSWIDFINFYNNENHKNYIEFVNNLERIILFFKADYNVVDNKQMLLLTELVMKNLSRPFLIKQLCFGDNESWFYDKKEYDSYYNNILDEHNLCLSTHLEFSQNMGKFEIVIHWPWCHNKIFESNFEKQVNEEDFININLKDILRYTPNSFVYENFENLYENFIPLLTKDYQFKTIENPENDSEINEYTNNTEYKLSPLYIELKSKFSFSSGFEKYCLNFRDLINKAPKDIYGTDFYISIPFWEIPRLQFINLEKHLKFQYELYCDERCQLDEVHDDYDYQKDVFDQSEIDNREEGRQLYKEYLDDLLHWDPNWKEDLDSPLDDGIN
jgi:hypothetical protein